MRKLVINSLTKKQIKHIYLKVQNKKNYIVSCVLCFVLIFSVLGFKSVSKLNGYVQICSKVYNPINPLFNESGGIVFASSKFSNASKINLKFITPIKSGVIELVEGDVCFTIDSSIMVVAPEDGIIKEIGYLPNGEKYIEIMHAKNVTTKIENIYITGVVSGQVVAKGKDIATVKLGDVVKFSIYENDIKQTNITLNKNQVEWEN